MFKLKFPPLLSRKKKKEEPVKRVNTTRNTPPVPVTEFGYKSIPRTIFIGSGKGGVGKSFISANLSVVLGALSRKRVYAVDLDLDNFSLSMVLPPAGTYSKIAKKLQSTNADEYLNLASVLLEGVIPPGSILPVITDTTYGCNGAPIKYEVRLIPAYNMIKLKEQQVALRHLDTRLLREGIEALMQFFTKKVANKEDVLAIFDGKQKSNIGIEYEPVYRVLLEYCDVFLLVTEPPYLSLSALLTAYKSVVEKTIVVVNKVETAHIQKLSVLIRDAKDMGIPVFIIPKSPSDAKLYVHKCIPPASESLSKTTAIFTMALAHYLNLLHPEALTDSGCGPHVEKILSMMQEL